MGAAIKPYSMAVTRDWSLTKRVSRLFIEDFSALRTKLTSLVYTIGNCNRFKALAKIFSAI
jgi:hypothetical protein